MALTEPQKLNHFIGESYHLSLNQSIQKLLDTIQEPNFDNSSFTSIFQELLKIKVDPPLETIWFYSALTFQKHNLEKDESLEQFSAIRSLFNKVTSFSASCSSSKSVALVAPVIYKLCELVGNLKANGTGSKKVMKEVKSLVDVILGYINVCVCENVVSGDELIRPLVDLVSIWVGDTMSEFDEKTKNLRCFFPLLSDEMVEGLSVKECNFCELSGVVIAEAFLLRMCLEFREGISRNVLQEELRTWAVGSVTAYKNVNFFETLLKMLLEQTLPVSSLLSSEDEIILRKVLYDVVILPEYSFLRPERITLQPEKQSLAVARLMVTHKATEIYRNNGDHAKAISYINAFSASHLPSELIKWVNNEIGMGNKASGPKGSSPKAVLKWIYNIEDQGINILDNDMSKYRAKMALDNLETDNEQSDFTGKKLDTDMLFYIDNKGDEEVNEETDDINKPISDAFVAAAHSLLSEENGGKRKRKVRRGSENQQVKSRKHSISERSLPPKDQSTTFGEDNSSSEGEVENPSSDED